MTRKSSKGLGTRKIPFSDLTAIEKIFRHVVETHAEFHADVIRSACLKKGIAYQTVSNALPRIFKTFLAAKFIEKTGRFILSRKDSQVILIYRQKTV